MGGKHWISYYCNDPVSVASTISKAPVSKIIFFNFKRR
jgi:hypothetical protein